MKTILKRKLSSGEFYQQLMKLKPGESKTYHLEYPLGTEALQLIKASLAECGVIVSFGNSGCDIVATRK